MNISEKEQLTINNEANKILNEYFSMLNHKDVVRRKINELLHVNLTKPLTVALLMGPAPRGVDSKRFKALVNIYISYMAQADQCKYKMIELFKPIVNHIIETEYASYTQHQENLYVVGISGVLLSMDQICPDPYAYYCQRIIVEMHQFLEENGLFKE